MIPTVNIPNGTYPATLTDYGIWEGKTGKVSVFIDLTVELGGSHQRLRWFGGTSVVIPPGKNKSPRDWTMETLTKVFPTFTWKNLIQKAKENIDDKELIGTEVSIVVINEVNPTTNKMQARVKYINSIQGKFTGLSVKALSSLGEGPDFGTSEDIGF